ncbi:MAG: alpha/beta hydrolase [Candidatus Azobacteroides sp.]|nr:alpha/beta hydrolase [Candidatus Azobacteroides sp.]
MHAEKIIYQSANKTHTIHASVWKPEGNPKAIIQIAHGMAEYIQRYEEFAVFLAKAGYLVCGNDHAGHGNSLNDDRLFGYFADRKGYEVLLKDFHTLKSIIQIKYPLLPYFIFGHSMGSLLSRYYLTEYQPSLAGYISMGTSGGNLLSAFGILLAEMMKRISGDKKPGNLINRIAFGNFNHRIQSPKTKNDWLSRDENAVAQYNQNEKTGFLFTNSGYKDLFYILYTVSKKKCLKLIPNIPILLISGMEDPVGDYGKGIRKLSEKLFKTGHTKVETKLYEGARHELLQEINKTEVIEDILEWIEKVLYP